MKNWWDIEICPLLLLTFAILVFCLALLFSLSSCTYAHSGSQSWSAFQANNQEIKDEEQFFKNAWIIILPGEKNEDR